MQSEGLGDIAACRNNDPNSTAADGASAGAGTGAGAAARSVPNILDSVVILRADGGVQEGDDVERKDMRHSTASVSADVSTKCDASVSISAANSCIAQSHRSSMALSTDISRTSQSTLLTLSDKKSMASRGEDALGTGETRPSFPQMAPNNDSIGIAVDRGQTGSDSRLVVPVPRGAYRKIMVCWCCVDGISPDSAMQPAERTLLVITAV